MNKGLLIVTLAALTAGGVYWFRASRAGGAPTPAAPVVPPVPVPVPAPAPIPTPPASPGGRYLTSGEVLAIIRGLNETEFGGWFDPYDVMAVVQNEAARGSGGTFDARSHGDLNRGDDSAYGVMQVLVSTARQMGLNSEPETLFDPVQGIRYGMRTLKWTADYMESRRPGEWDKLAWVGAYNAGVGNWQRGWRSEAYVSKWQRHRSQWPT